MLKLSRLKVGHPSINFLRFFGHAAIVALTLYTNNITAPKRKCACWFSSRDRVRPKSEAAKDIPEPSCVLG